MAIYNAVYYLIWSHKQDLQLFEHRKQAVKLVLAARSAFGMICISELSLEFMWLAGPKPEPGCKGVWEL